MRALRLQGQCVARDSSYDGRLWTDLQVVLDKVPEPILAVDEVLVAPAVCGICGSDVAACKEIQEGGSSFRGPLSLPVTLGHEFAGRVVASTSHRFRVGDLVAAESVVACGHCRSCRTGLRDSCLDVQLIGLTRDGAFADLVAVPASACWEISTLRERYNTDHLAFRASALLELFGCAYNALFCAHRSFHPGCVVCVEGIGGLGAAVALLASAAGAGKIICIEKDAERRKWASETITATPMQVSFTEQLTEHELRTLTHGTGVDLYVVTSGVSTPPEMALKALAPGASVVLMSRGPILTGGLTDKLVDMRGSIVGARGQSSGNILGHLITLCVAGVIEPERIITSTIDLNKAKDLLAHSGELSGVGRILVQL